GDRQVGLVQERGRAETGERCLPPQLPPREAMQFRVQRVEQSVGVVDGRYGCARCTCCCHNHTPRRSGALSMSSSCPALTGRIESACRLTTDGSKLRLNRL